MNNYLINIDTRLPLVILSVAMGLVSIQTASGDIFVANNIGGPNQRGSVSRYTPSGSLVSEDLIPGIAGPFGIAVEGGYLYVTHSFGKVGKYTISGETVNADLISGLLAPAGIAVSGGYLYVANSGSESSTVGKYTLTGETVNASLISGLGNPVGLEISENTLYVSEWHTGKVGKYFTTGETINSSLITGLLYPAGLELDDVGSLFVAHNLGLVGHFTSSCTLVNRALIDVGYSSGVGLELNENGNILAANNFGGLGGNRIAEYSASGRLLNATFITGLKNPVDIAVERPVTASPVPDEVPSAVFLLSMVSCWMFHRSIARQNVAKGMASD